MKARRLLLAVVTAATAVLALPLAVGLGVGAGAAPPAAAAISSPAAVPGIPADYLADFEASGQRFGVPWPVLAGIYQLECDFGRSLLAGCSPRGTENRAGAQGPGQWLPGTWRRGLAPHQLIPAGPPTTATSNGFATDGDRDGIADPWDAADAVASTARLLAANGGGTGDLSGAIYRYNHDLSYVQAVLALAARYQAAESTPAPGATGELTTGGVVAVLAFAQSQVGKPYQWGGSGPAAWDCSGLVQAAYRQAGVALAHNAAAQYAATAAATVPLSQLQPGDLVFFGRSPASIHHVGIYVGNSSMVDAPHTGAVVRVEPIGWPDLLAATRPLVAATG